MTIPSSRDAATADALAEASTAVSSSVDSAENASSSTPLTMTWGSRPAARNTARRAGEAEASTRRTHQNIRQQMTGRSIVAMRFGLVGTGYWADSTHAPALATTPGARLASVWGRNADAAAALAAGTACPPTTTSTRSSPASTRSRSRCRRTCRHRSRSARPRRASTCCSRSRSRCRSRTPTRSPPRSKRPASPRSCSSPGGSTARSAPGWPTSRPGAAGRAAAGRAGSRSGSARRSRTTPRSTRPWRQQKGALWDLGPHLVGMLWACLGPVTSVSAVRGQGDVRHLVLQHEGGASSTMTTALDAPEPAEGFNLFVWGAAGRSIMPATPAEPDALPARRRRRAHRERELGPAESPVRRPLRPRHRRRAGRGRGAASRASAKTAGLPHRTSTLSSGSNHAGHCTYVRVSA